ncbi:WD repeat-containing protein 43 [Glycine soja]|nr:hypothetical protein JHK87_038237 [Glycine soja]KAH1105219.1 hypothetical protein GYH30_038470 [Glycine max]
METKIAKTRQAISDPHLPITTNTLDFGEVAVGILHDVDSSEPTMGEKLAALSFPDENKFRSDKEQDSSAPTKPPSADSVHVLLRQALNADDRTLLLDCLYTQDEKVITKSIAQLNSPNVLKFLHSLISITESRGAILACALPWLKCLVLHHASVIMSQESSLHVLNSLYQLIESRVSSFESAVHLSSCLDIHYTRVVDEVVDDDVLTVPVIYADDSSEESEELETDEDDNDEAFEGFSDIEDINDMMSE